APGLPGQEPVHRGAVLPHHEQQATGLGRARAARQRRQEGQRERGAGAAQEGTTAGTHHSSSGSRRGARAANQADAAIRSNVVATGAPSGSTVAVIASVTSSGGVRPSANWVANSTKQGCSFGLVRIAAASSVAPLRRVPSGSFTSTSTRPPSCHRAQRA